MLLRLLTLTVAITGVVVGAGYLFYRDESLVPLLVFVGLTISALVALRDALHSPLPTWINGWRRLRRVRRASSQLRKEYGRLKRYSEARGLLRLTGNEVVKDGERRSWDTEAVSRHLVAGHSVTLAGEPGSGKSFFTIGVSREVEGLGKIPLIVSVPEWCRSGERLPDFIARGMALRTNGATSDDLIELAEDGMLVFLVDGMNEVPREAAAGVLRELVARDEPFLLTSRHGTQVTGAVQLELSAVDPEERDRLVGERLGSAAGPLIQVMEADRDLAEVARVPLFLDGLIELSSGGDEPPANRALILEALVLSAEREHEAELLTGAAQKLHREYLVGLALEMSDRRTTSLDRRDVLVCLGKVSGDLRTRNQIGQSPNAADVLESLEGLHLLARFGETIQFVHQQFQEWFTAQYLVNGVLKDAAKQGIPDEVCDEVRYTESLALSVEHLVSQGDISTCCSVVDAMVGFDPILASELSRICGVPNWAEVSGRLPELLRGLYGSDCEDLRNYGLAGIVASGSEEFADIVVEQLGEENSDILDLGRFPMSLLGTHWEDVVATWDSDMKLRFMSQTLWNGDLDHVKLCAKLGAEDSDWRVRREAVHMLYFAGHRATADAVLESFGIEEVPIDVLAELRDYLPKAWKVQVKDRLRQNAPLEDLPMQIALIELMVEFEDDDAASIIQYSLESVGDRSQEPYLLEKLQVCSAGAANDYVVSRLLDGDLWDEWIVKYLDPSPDDCEALAEFVARGGLGQHSSHQVLRVLKGLEIGAAQGTILDVFFLEGNLDRDLKSDLGQIIVELPLHVTVEYVLNRFGQDIEEQDLRDILAVLPCFHRDDEKLRRYREIEPGLRERLRKRVLSWLESGVVRTDEERGTRAELACILGGIGDERDVDRILELLESDERSHDELRKQVSPIAGHCLIDYFIVSLHLMDSGKANQALTCLLKQDRYIDAAASELTNQVIGEPSGWDPLKQRPRIAERREALTAKHAPERLECAEIIRSELLSHLERAEARKGGTRLGRGACDTLRSLARLGDTSVPDLFLRICGYVPEEGDLVAEIFYDGEIARLAGAIADHGYVVDGERLESILRPILERHKGRAFHDSESRSTVHNAIDALLLSSKPKLGLDAFAQLQKSAAQRVLEVVLPTMAKCDDGDVARYLVGLSEDDLLSGQSLDAWLQALASTPRPEGKEKLLQLIDNAEEEALRHGWTAEVVSKIVSTIVEAAKEDETFWQQIVDRCQAAPSPVQIQLLSRVLSEICTEGAALCAVQLLEPSGRGWRKIIEEVLIEKRPAGSPSSYYRIPRAANSVREALAGRMLSSEGGERKIAARMLLSIELLRLESGKPDDEPRLPSRSLKEIETHWVTVAA